MSTLHSSQKGGDMGARKKLAHQRNALGFPDQGLSSMISALLGLSHLRFTREELEAMNEGKVQKLFNEHVSSKISPKFIDDLRDEDESSRMRRR
jgi:hypothetical protein